MRNGSLAAHHLVLTRFVKMCKIQKDIDLARGIAVVVAHAFQDLYGINLMVCVLTKILVSLSIINSRVVGTIRINPKELQYNRIVEIWNAFNIPFVTINTRKNSKWDTII
eukprot:scaffold2719_cov266-Chaetoceros_neogracile.AAC.20